MKKKLNGDLKLIKGARRDPNLLERNSMVQKIDATVVEAICRTLGRSDWEMDAAMFKRGKWMEYPDGEEVFSFDGKEKFLIGPWEYNILDDTCGRRLEWLFDKENYQHHTKEDEAG